MSRWIDADALKKMIDKEIFRHDTIDHVFQIIDDAPSIDIVTCGECKYWIDDRKAEEDMGTCGLTHYFTNADDFCSYGEREGE